MDPGSFNLDNALVNLQTAFQSIRFLIGALSYVIGVALIMKGLMSYRALANQTMASAQRGELAGPFVFIFIGVILIYFPSTLETGLTTIFASDSIGKASELIAYAGISSDERWRDIATIVIDYVNLIGYIAFLRGWIILSKMGHSGSQPGSVGKGVIHVVAGVLLINIVYSFQILSNTIMGTGVTP